MLRYALHTMVSHSRMHFSVGDFGQEKLSRVKLCGLCIKCRFNNSEHLVLSQELCGIEKVSLGS